MSPDHASPAPRSTVLFNARLIDPESGYDGPGAVLIERGRIAAVRREAEAELPEGAEAIDCGGRALAPGIIDMRVFLGEPGERHKESFRSAGRAAGAGGVTTIATQPSTDPAIDEPAILEFVRRRAAETCAVRVAPIAALTKGLAGREMTEFQFLLDSGAVAFSDADRAVGDPLVFRRCLEYATSVGALVIHHAQEPILSAAGCATESAYATRMGLPGIPAAAETMMLERDLALVALTGARYHMDQISVAASLAPLRRARDAGLPVSAAVSVTHFALNEFDIADYRTFSKCAPPLRIEADRAAIETALAEGLIDVIVSSHSPQDEESKRLPFEIAAVGAVGLETILPLSLALHHEGRISLPALFDKLSLAPARLLGFDAGRIAPGAPADLILFDVNAPWVLDRRNLHSKSKNTPFHQRRLQGRVLRTLVAGRTVYDRAAED